MSPLRNLVLLFLAAQSTTAHFLLHYPSTIGFDDDAEVDAPCGSFTVDFSTDNVTDFHVDNDVIAVESIHPQATWLFRATLDTTASSNWTSLVPAVLQTALGAYCETGINVPSSWAGSKGVIGVVQDAPDGILYQCAAVNFVTGSSNSTPSVCTNVTGLTATYTSDAKLSSLPASSTPTATDSTTSGTSTATKSASAGVLKPVEFGAVGAAAWVVLVGGLKMALALL
ncbi:uncharacterized protein LY89DRAFT_681363 [Mollisia scopiformis]|uniref:Copper acquisition factor BIM1-like domain-containing protein n=1 Tax=Mollisia scopiformis TaxID=149040 RepID=A0A194XPD5_MOLSC|nr:uncharacterized protein LY89DRAFT_681363 [Mollisia scopiformis]KUJ22026.1 hypothetical protein LY89DRAFT_681363 [Mollisia scopiformis]